MFFIYRTFTKYQISKVVTISQNGTDGNCGTVFNHSHKDKNVCIIIYIF